MARPLRIEFPGAIYHVMSRGNVRQTVFRDDTDYQRLIKGLETVVGRLGWARSQKAVDPGTSGSPKKPVFPRNLIVLLCTPDVNLTMTYLIPLVFFEVY